MVFTLSSCIRGYHVYKDIWDPPVSKVVVCKHENRNPRDPQRDPYGVVMKDSVTVSHIPCAMSCICHCF